MGLYRIGYNVLVNVLRIYYKILHHNINYKEKWLLFFIWGFGRVRNLLGYWKIIIYFNSLLIKFIDMQSYFKVKI